MHHWRSHGGAEVDIVLERAGILFPIEVKLASQPARNDCRGLQAFRATYPTARIATALIIAASPSFHPISENECVMPFDAA